MLNIHCRSLCMVTRLALNTSNLGSRYIVTTYNNQLFNFPHQQNRYLAQKTPYKRPPGRIRRFLRWFGWGAEPVVSNLPEPEPPVTTIQRIKRFFFFSPSIERFFLRSRIIEDEDLARLLSKTAAVTVYAMISVSALGTLGVDTKPLLTGIGVTGFTIGFALKEVATNFISGIFLVIYKPFVRGCRIKIHGSGGGIEGLVHFIDIRYVHLKTKDRGMVMVPSAIVYTNAFTVFPADDEANAGFIDMTKPPQTDATKSSESPPPPPPPSSPTPSPISSKKKDLKMKFEAEPAGSFKKSALNDKL